MMVIAILVVAVATVVVVKAGWDVRAERRRLEELLRDERDR